MTVRLLIIAAVLAVPAVAFADEGAGDGENLFKAKCQACHELNQVQGLLMPKPPAERPAHLTKFLETHPDRLNAAEKQSVIPFLSRPEKK